MQKMLSGQDTTHCPRCKRALEGPRPFELTSELKAAIAANIAAETSPLDADSQAAQFSQPAKRKTKDGPSQPQRQRRRGDDFNGVQLRDKIKRNLALLEDSDRNISATPMLMSSKVTGIIELITEWQQVAPDDKIIGEQLIYPGRVHC